MHVIKVRDEHGAERIYAAKLLKRTDDALTFDFNGKELIVRIENLLDIVRVAEDKFH